MLLRINGIKLLGNNKNSHIDKKGLIGSYKNKWINKEYWWNIEKLHLIYVMGSKVTTSII